MKRVSRWLKSITVAAALAAPTVAMAFYPSAAQAHETDQFTLPPDREFVDLGPHFNRYFYDRIDGGVAALNAQIKHRIDAEGASARLDDLHAPEAVAIAVNKQMPYAMFLIEGIEKMRANPDTWDKWPGQLVGFKTFTKDIRQTIEPSWHPFRPWMGSTIKVYGTYVGTDKVGHFTDMGMHYYRAYLAARKDGLSEDEAMLKAKAVGTHGLILSERGLLGNMTAGAYSNADLVANYSGMLFYRNLAEEVRIKGEPRPPMVVRDGNYWKVAPHVRPDSDFFAVFISDHLNEVLNPSLYLSHYRARIKQSVANRRSIVLERLADEHGNRRTREWFAKKHEELRTYYGADYGHEGKPEELALVAEECFPAPAPSAEANTRDRAGRTPLHVAAARGEVDSVRAWIAAGGEVNAQVRSGEAESSEWGMTPLHLAAAAGKLDAVRALVDAGADVTATDDRKVTPLHRAVAHPQIAKLLIDRGADVNAADGRGETPIHWAARDASGGAALATLLDAAPDLAKADRDGRTALHVAAARGNMDAARELIRAGADPTAADAFETTPLHLAARQSSPATLAVLLRGTTPGNIDVRDAFGCTPLHDAARAGSEHTLALLLESGADGNATHQYGGTPLHLAARYGREVNAQVLLARGVDAFAASAAGRTPLHEAALSGNPTVARLLVEHADRSTLAARDRDGRTPADLATQAGFRQVASILREAN